MANRKNVSSLSNAGLAQLRTLLDQYINKPPENPVTEHRTAGADMSLMIHDCASCDVWFVPPRARTESTFDAKVVQLRNFVCDVSWLTASKS